MTITAATRPGGQTSHFDVSLEAKAIERMVEPPQLAGPRRRRFVVVLGVCLLFHGAIFAALVILDAVCSRARPKPIHAAGPPRGAARGPCARGGRRRVQTRRPEIEQSRQHLRIGLTEAASLKTASTRRRERRMRAPVERLERGGNGHCLASTDEFMNLDAESPCALFANASRRCRQLPRP